VGTQRVAVRRIVWLDIWRDIIERYSPPAKEARNTIAPANENDCQPN
jgi:hypothetical protein